MSKQIGSATDFDVRPKLIVLKRVFKKVPGSIELFGALRSYLFKRRFGFLPPPPGTDQSTGLLLDDAIASGCFSRPGDVVEIGAFLGGGTYILSNFLALNASSKRLFTIDIFDPRFDVTPCTKGYSMSSLYAQALAGRSQEDVFRQVTKDSKNLTVLKADSKHVCLPCDSICFAFIDGNHEFSYVKHDFKMVWDKLVSGGVVALDDYGFDIPEVTQAIHQLIGEHSSEIKRFYTRSRKTIFIEKG
jgi:predicted O-methyltransferase YrrM